MTFSLLLKRVFKIDITKCESCGGRQQPENQEVVTHPSLIAPILIGLGLNAVPLQRGPPRVQKAWFDPDNDQSQPDYD